MPASEQKIKKRVREQIDKNQREYYLREQLKAIHDELSRRGRQRDRGAAHPHQRARLAERRRGQAAQGTDAAGAHALRLRRGDRRPHLPRHAARACPGGADDDRLDLDEAETILNDDHYGLEQVKERILDFLAVRKLTSRARHDRCGVGADPLPRGPPGVGKTSLGRSIASSMGRKFVRVSLGGVRDEAEIRGHRRTYIGAMPGRIIGAMKTGRHDQPGHPARRDRQALRRLPRRPGGGAAGSARPGAEPQLHRPLPRRAVRPLQVLFITTANYLGQIPRPLRDRMEIIEISGYTEDEKIEIGKRYLLPKATQRARPGAKSSLEIPRRSGRRIVREYTREAGVRELDREIATICRKVARDSRADGNDRRRQADPDRAAPGAITSGPRSCGFEHELGEQPDRRRDRASARPKSAAS